jgi:hypothetical protein
VTNDEALFIYQAGQTLLRALHPHYADYELEEFDRGLGNFYELAGLKHELCYGCDADCPNQLLVEGRCPACRGGPPKRLTR